MVTDVVTTYEHRYVVVVAGGSGTRLWPASRRELPKQMQAFVSDRTLIAETVERLRAGSIPADHIYISTTQNYADRMRCLLPDLPPENIIVEPVPRGTAAAFALFTTVIADRDPDAVLFTLASDHAVTGLPEFHATMRRCYEYVECNRDAIALVGIKPTRADTALGYIKVREPVSFDPLIYSAEKFVEKPSLEVATQYAASGEHFWNAAYYCFDVKTLIKAYLDGDARLINAARAFSFSGLTSDYEDAPEKVHEIEFLNSQRYPLVIVPGEFQWSDIGNWNALHSLLARVSGDSSMVVKSRHHVDVNSSNCLVFSQEDRLVATIGLENIVVVSTDDVLLVLNKNEPEQLPALLGMLRQEGLSEYL